MASHWRRPTLFHRIIFDRFRLKSCASETPWRAPICSAAALATASLIALSAGIPSACAQGLPVARLQCKTQLGQVRITGEVDVSLFQTGTVVDMGNAAERQLIRNLALSGRAHEIPGVLVLVGVFDAAGDRMDFEVSLTGGSTGTGQYWMNGQSHRGTIFDLALIPGGFLGRDENGLTATYQCQ